MQFQRSEILIQATSVDFLLWFASIIVANNVLCETVVEMPGSLLNLGLPYSHHGGDFIQKSEKSEQ